MCGGGGVGKSKSSGISIQNPFDQSVGATKAQTKRNKQSGNALGEQLKGSVLSGIVGSVNAYGYAEYTAAKEKEAAAISEAKAVRRKLEEQQRAEERAIQARAYQSRVSLINRQRRNYFGNIGAPNMMEGEGPSLVGGIGVSSSRLIKLG